MPRLQALLRNSWQPAFETLREAWEIQGRLLASSKEECYQLRRQVASLERWLEEAMKLNEEMAKARNGQHG